MKFLTVRFTVALITFVVGVAAASLWFFHPTRHSTNPAALTAQPRTRTSSEEILRVLMPNGASGDAGRLGRFDRAEEIRVLREAQVDAKDTRAISIAFLLAASGHEYEANRETLLDALSRCPNQPRLEGAACSEFIADYLMELCRRGDASLFQPLFDVSDKANGSFSQSLGAFYADMLRAKPEQFIKALASRSKKAQRKFCYRAGVGDGGGMHEGMLRDIRESLSRMAALPDNSLAPVARACKSGVEAGAKHAAENNGFTDGQWASTTGNSLGLIVLSKGYSSKDFIRIYNEDGSLWYTFTFYYDDSDGKFEYANESFAPFAFHPDYFLLALKCTRKEAGRYEVIVNEETGLKKYVKAADPSLRFETWDAHILKLFAVGFDRAANPLREVPQGRVKKVAIPDELFHPVRVRGEWLKVKWDAAGGAEKKGTRYGYGWVRWKRDEKLLVELFYIC